MTDQQIIEQLRRLKIFGQIDETDAGGYTFALRDIGYTELIKSVDSLIKNYDKHRFPLPSEILVAAREVSIRESNDEERKLRQEKYTGSHNATQSFAAAFKLVWLIENDNIRKKFWEEKLIVGNNESDESCINKYNAVRSEIETYLKAEGIMIPKFTREICLVPELQEDELGF